MIDMDTVIAMIETLGERLAKIETRLDNLENSDYGESGLLPRDCCGWIEWAPFYAVRHPGD